MDLAEVLRKNRKKIVEQWVDYTLSTYKSSRFFRQEGDNFANPIGGVTKGALSELFLLLVENGDPETFVKPIEKIVRLRAIQDFSPSQAVSPFHAVKHITRDLLAKDDKQCHLINELYDFEFAVDMAVLAAFDIYLDSRERLYRVRLEELHSGRNIYTDSKCPSLLLRDDQRDIIKKIKSH